jgi:hypothetical protein
MDAWLREQHNNQPEIAVIEQQYMNFSMEGIAIPD